MESKTITVTRTR